MIEPNQIPTTTIQTKQSQKLTKDNENNKNQKNNKNKNKKRENLSKNKQAKLLFVSLLLFCSLCLPLFSPSLISTPFSFRFLLRSFPQTFFSSRFIFSFLIFYSLFLPPSIYFSFPSFFLSFFSLLFFIFTSSFPSLPSPLLRSFCFNLLPIHEPLIQYFAHCFIHLNHFFLF